MKTWHKNKIQTKKVREGINNEMMFCRGCLIFQGKDIAFVKPASEASAGLQIKDEIAVLRRAMAPQPELIAEPAVHQRQVQKSTAQDTEHGLPPPELQHGDQQNGRDLGLALGQ